MFKLCVYFEFYTATRMKLLHTKVMSVVKLKSVLFHKFRIMIKLEGNKIFLSASPFATARVFPGLCSDPGTTSKDPDRLL
jgi:hypothetical protein